MGEVANNNIKPRHNQSLAFKPLSHEHCQHACIPVWLHQHATFTLQHPHQSHPCANTCGCVFMPLLCTFPLLSDDNITVTASPDLLAVSGSWVTVTYKGVEKPSKDDLVAVYSPTPDRPSLDPRKSAPVKYIVSAGRSSSSCLCTCRLCVRVGIWHTYTHFPHCCHVQGRGECSCTMHVSLMCMLALYI